MCRSVHIEDDERASKIPSRGCPQQEETAPTNSRPQSSCVSENFKHFFITPKTTFFACKRII